MNKTNNQKPIRLVSRIAHTSSRRDFLKQAGAGTLLVSTLGLSACGGGSGDNSAASSSGPKNVLVLGAGAAGLTAALALKKQGHKVTIIEYQDRIGGRLWSKELKGGQYTEKGAGHFSIDMPLVVALVDRYDLPLLTVNDGSTRYLMGDRPPTDSVDLKNWPWNLTEKERLSSLASSVGRYLVGAGIELKSVLDSSWPDAAAIAKFDNVKLKDIFLGQGCSQDFLSLLNVHLGAPVTEGETLTSLSALAYFFNAKSYFRVEGGNDRISTEMAKELGLSSIILGAPVVGIDQTGTQVKVTVKDGRVFQADKVVSTIPFSVMNDVDVQPAWSSEKVRMFAGYSWVDNYKGVVQTQSPSWLDSDIYGWPMAASDRIWRRAMDITGDQSGGYGNFFFYVYGDPINTIKNWPQDQRTQNLLTQFQTDMPGLVTSTVVTKDGILWSEQPWIKAAWAGGVKPWMRQEWRIPEGRIHFAGDFTSYKSGWLEGALESGLRAAAEIDPRANYF